MPTTSQPVSARPKRPRSPLERLRFGAAAFADALATPHVPGDFLDLVSPLRAGADLRGRIEAIHPETEDTVTVILRPGGSWKGHIPGQYIRIGIDIDGVRHWRAYSLTSRVDSFAHSGTISFTTKVIPGGMVSTYLVRRAVPGEFVMMDQATGDFVLPDTLPDKILFLTAGSGITPVAAMLRNHLHDLTDVVHIQLSSTSTHVIFGDELRGYQEHEHYRLIEHFDDVSGIFQFSSLPSVVPDWTERQAWVCGPTELLDAAEELYAGADIEDALHVERFRPKIAEPGQGGIITFAKTDKDVETDGSTTILDAGEESGVLMPSGCRMGICFGCVVTMKEGAVRDLRNGEVLAAEEGAPLPIQTCINAVAGRATLEL